MKDSRFREVILVVDDAPLKDRATRDGPGMRRHGPQASERFERGRVEVVVRHY
jgi:hypothetical protein